MYTLFDTASDEHKKKERAKARELKQSLWWRQKVGQGLCYHCGQKFESKDLTMDHLWPIARGGKTHKKNCVVSCLSCNRSRGHLSEAEKQLLSQSQTN